MKQLTENKSKTNITNELTHREAEKRQGNFECMQKHHKRKVFNVLLKSKSMIRLKQA